MLEKLKMAGIAARDAVAKTAVLVGDLNGDGKVDEEDAKIAAEWAKRKAVVVGNETAKLAKEAARSDLAKDAATGAAVGAAIAIPVPVIGPIAGAAVGAMFGAYRNLTGKSIRTDSSPAAPVKDVHAELLKLQDLKEKRVLTEEEFLREKTKLLAG
jgi:hypothetical protein